MMTASRAIPVPGRGGRGPSGASDDDDSQFSPGTIVGSLVTGGAGGLAGGPRAGQPWRLFEPLDVSAAAAAASLLATSAPASTSFFSSSHFRGSPEPSATHQPDRAAADRSVDRSDRAEHRLDRVERGLSPSGHTFGHGPAHPYQIRPRSRKQTRANEQPRLDLDLDEEDRRLFGEAKDYIHRRGRRNALANLMDRSPHGGAEVAMSAASLPSWSPLNMQLAAEHAARCFGSAPIFPTADAEQLEQDFDERCRVSE